MPVLVAVERPLELAHHDCVESAIRIGQSGQHPRGLRTLRPGQLTRAANIKEFRHDHAPTVDQLLGEVVLPPR
nr:hypothetical protein [Rugosimonospora africana]